MPVLPNGRCTFARRRHDGALVGILEVPNGLLCGCDCPNCGKPLLAKQGSHRGAHFAHVVRSSSCGMGWWHASIRDCIVGLQEIDFGIAAPYSRLKGRHRIIRASKEKRVLDGEFQLDVFLELQCGDRIAVEVVDSSEIDGLKWAALTQEVFQVLRIDAAAVRRHLGELPVPAASLQRLLASPGDWQAWPRLFNGATQLTLPLSKSWRNFLTSGLVSSRRSSERNMIAVRPFNY